MSNLKQLALSVVVILAAGAIVAFRLDDGDAAAASNGMAGHNHAAMTAAKEQKPVRLAAEDARRIGVTYATVERRGLDLAVEALGTVAYDETRLTTVNPKVDGWVEHLFVDFTGAPVKAGQPLFALYSPKLVSAQEELVLAARLAREAPSTGRAADNALALLESARKRLAYWDVPPEEIRRVEETGEVVKTLTLRAPASGIVVEKNVIEGDRITPGMTLYRIADLSRVWIEADVFEKDLGLVREGQAGTVRFEAYPGHDFEARVTYVYPSVSLESRTGRIRLELANPDLRLRPGMYADIDLVIPPSEPTLVVPRSAVLSTGTRSLVFVQAADGSLVPRSITPGRTVRRDVEVVSGLAEGERVVSSAAFLVDAESNLGALTAGMDMSGDMEASASDSAAAGAMDMDQSSMKPPAGNDGHQGHDGSH